MNIIESVYKLGMKLSNNNEKFYYAMMKSHEYRILKQRLESQAVMKTSNRSKSVYEKYDDREQKDFECRSSLSLFNNCPNSLIALALPFCTSSPECPPFNPPICRRV